MRILGTCLEGQWLRLYASIAKGTGSIPGQGTKVLHATGHGQKLNKRKKKMRTLNSKQCQQDPIKEASSNMWGGQGWWYICFGIWYLKGFPGGSEVKESAWNVGDPGSIPGSGRSPAEGNGQPTPVLLPRKFHGWRSLVGYSPWGRKESDTTERLHFPYTCVKSLGWPASLCVLYVHF